MPNILLMAIHFVPNQKKTSVLIIRAINLQSLRICRDVIVILRANLRQQDGREYDMLRV